MSPQTRAALNIPAHQAPLQVLEALAENPDTAPLFRKALQRQIAFQKRHDLESQRYSGVSWSGLSPEPFELPSVEEIEAQAMAEDAVVRAFRASPRGRFIAAVTELTNVGFHEAESARAIYCRCLADAREDLDTDAVGRAIRILTDIPHTVALDAIRALTELLAPQVSRAA